MRNLFKQVKGYTLIETAVVLVVVGMLVGTFATAYTLYSRDKDFRETNESIESTTSALLAYANMFGRYPCPSQPNLGRGQPGHGMPLCAPDNDLANAIPAAGNCFEYGTTNTGLTEGLCVEETAAATPADKRVLKGTIPFKALNIPEKDSLDQYGNKINYVVTYSMVDKDTFSIEPGFSGAVLLVDNNDNIITEGTDGAHFYLFSSGKNGDGAYTRDGVLSATCPTPPAQENENCDTLVGDGIYRHAEQTSLQDNTYFDDQGFYRARLRINQWEYPADDSDDIVHKVPGKLVIGAPPSADLTNASKLEVKGLVLVDGGVIQSDKLCDTTATHADMNPNCFTSAMIGGQLSEGEGLECPDDDIDGIGQYMVGIQNGRVICEDEIYVSCPDGTFVTEINPDGTIECSIPPPESCDPMTLTICGRDVTNGPRLHGQSAYWRSGICYEKDTPTSALVPEDCSMYGREFKCDDGNWIERWTGYGTYPCECTEDYRTEDDVLCDPGYTGTMSRIDKYYCPERTWGVYERGIDDNCVCVPAIDDRPGSCPSGLIGSPVARWVMDCVTETWVYQGEIGTGCTCPDYPDDRDTVGCDDGFSGTYEVVTKWICPDGVGGSQPGFWDTASTIENENCGCDNSYFEYETDPCPPGEVGTIGMRYKKQWVCDTPTSGHFDPRVPDINDCVPIVPPVCHWESSSNPVNTEEPMGNARLGDSCTCGVDTAPYGCYEGGSGAAQWYQTCLCK